MVSLARQRSMVPCPIYCHLSIDCLQTCVLDILRHIPRCSFSKKQNTAIHWAMLALGLKDLPSDRIMDDIDKALQKMCGIQSIRYAGKLGHIYYVNDLAAIIAQVMDDSLGHDFQIN